MGVSSVDKWPLMPAGNGRSSEFLILIESFKITHPPFDPGTDPLTNIKPFSLSVLIICKFCVVTVDDPIWPAIFLPLNTLPGSWHWPVEPWLLWLIETPCDARSPPKLCLFIAPAKPLPIEVAVTSTNCPSTKCEATISVPLSIIFSGDTLNSESFNFGSTLFLEKWPFIDFESFFSLIFPTPICIAK